MQQTRIPPTPSADPVDWEERYASAADEYFFGREPSVLARLAVHFWRLIHGERPARVLDLGCGEGRDAVYFAEQCWRVTAVDQAPSGVHKAARLADERHVRLDAVHCTDLRDCLSEGDHTLVFAGNSLTALGDDCLPFLARMRDSTPAGGLNAVRVATRDAWGQETRQGPYRFDRNELKLEYRGWRLLYYGEDLLYVRHLDGLASFADIVAQRP